jgi:hypothetical protein
MPDGDKVQSEVGGKYRQGYRQICGGTSNDNELAIAVVAPTIKKIQDYGDEPIQLIARVAKVCEEIRTKLPLFREEINWNEKLEQVDTLAQQACMDKRAKNLAIKACKDQIKALRDGEESANVHIDMLNRYLWNVYRADFEAYVEAAPDHYRDADSAVVNATLERMRPHVKEKLLKVAEQAYSQETTRSLRQPIRYPGKKKGVPLNTDLLSGLEV